MNSKFEFREGIRLSATIVRVHNGKERRVAQFQTKDVIGRRFFHLALLMYRGDEGEREKMTLEWASGSDCSRFRFWVRPVEEEETYRGHVDLFWCYGRNGFFWYS